MEYMAISINFSLTNLDGPVGAAAGHAVALEVQAAHLPGVARQGHHRPGATGKDKMNCAMRFGNSFLLAPLMSQP